MYGAGSELSIVSRSTMSTWISDRHFVDEIHKKRRRVCKRWRKTCTRDLLYRRLPFLSWITKYDFSKLLSDANAGMAVSLTAIPQTIGYAAVAGLPAQVSVPRTLLLCFFLPGLFFFWFRVICCVCSEQFFTSRTFGCVSIPKLDRPLFGFYGPVDVHFLWNRQRNICRSKQCSRLDDQFLRQRGRSRLRRHPSLSHWRYPVNYWIIEFR